MDEREKGFKKVLGRIQKKRSEARPSTSPKGLQQILHGEIPRLENEAFEILFNVKVCDPAMGSGHFLVDACEFIARRISDILERYPDNPVENKVHELRRKLLETAGEKGYQLNEEHLTNERLIQRLVLKRCIYGVDLNPLAVELAKLSLWLHCFTEGGPLSFLDHHLKCGNSLIGASYEEIQLGLLNAGLFSRIPQDFPRIVGVMQVIADLTDITMEQVAQSVSKYKESEGLMKPARRIFDSWTAEYFGHKGIQKFLRGGKAVPKGWDTVDVDALPDWFRPGLEEARKTHFFHWELEFPEVFFDRNGALARYKRGFDAVIGTPPYISVEKMRTADRDFLMKRLKSAQKRFDIYVGFIEHGLRLLRYGGRLGYIVPYPLLSQDYGEKLRDMILRQTKILEIVDIKRFKVFADPKVRSIVILLTPCEDQSEAVRHEMAVLHVTQDLNKVDGLGGFRLRARQSGYLGMPSKMIRTEVYGERTKVIRRCKADADPLGKIAIGGVGARAVPQKQFHLAKPVNEDCKKMLKGDDIQRYSCDWSGMWLLYDPARLYRPAMPQFFENEKLVIQEVTGDSGIRAAFDANGFYTDHSICCCVRADKLRDLSDKVLRKRKIQLDRSFLGKAEKYDLRFLLALLCSRLLNFYFRLMLGYDLNVYPESIEKLPIRRIAFTTPPNERAGLLNKGKQLYERCLSKGDNDCVLEFVEQELSGTPEHADVVHDLLAFLAEQMTEMNKQKQVEVKRFLTWLERHIAARVNDLSNKTKLRAYHEHDINTLVSILEQNRRRLTTRLTPALEEDIEREFKNSMRDLAPLKQKISATDRLIDLIVYRLYGLTDEEAAIVERGSNAE
jgi:hypothetical protein